MPIKEDLSELVNYGEPEAKASESVTEDEYRESPKKVKPPGRLEIHKENTEPNSQIFHAEDEAKA